ncbi:uncharacterized protein LOC123024945 isoform X2 [Varanus komodoensis]|uniref:uncharacterized protein LOC123024945 isoform X2 n=1 Tax=Varanus komodoensis TaxID=61221 RepID=UPI001CF7AE77|nr:uncharacterized protein LOC123024945 isoform X2 [Varanus komodoensis]
MIWRNIGQWPLPMVLLWPLCAFCQLPHCRRREGQMPGRRRASPALSHSDSSSRQDTLQWSKAQGAKLHLKRIKGPSSTLTKGAVAQKQAVMGGFQTTEQLSQPGAIQLCGITMLAGQGLLVGNDRRCSPDWDTQQGQLETFPFSLEEVVLLPLHQLFQDYSPVQNYLGVNPVETTSMPASISVKKTWDVLSKHTDQHVVPR